MLLSMLPLTDPCRSSLTCQSTVASPTGEISPFCALFTDEEFIEYNYYGTLDKYA